MALEWIGWLHVFRDTPEGYNDASWVTIERPDKAQYRCIGVHFLSGEENQGNHHVFLGVVDERGQRVQDVGVAWTWEGRHANEMALPVILDKPASEPPGNLALNAGQVVSVWVDGVAGSSDTVRGLTSTPPDVPEQPGSTWGHRSYLVIFQRGAPIPQPQPLPLPQPEPPLEPLEPQPPPITPPVVPLPADREQLLAALRLTIQASEELYQAQVVLNRLLAG